MQQVVYCLVIQNVYLKQRSSIMFELKKCELIPIKQQKSLTDAIVKRTISTVPDHIIIASTLKYFHSCISQGLFLNRMKFYQVRTIAVFTVFRFLTDCVCLLTYAFCLSLRKIVRCSVILLLPLCIHSGMLAISYHTLLTDIYNKTWLILHGGNIITYRSTSLY